MVDWFLRIIDPIRPFYSVLNFFQSFKSSPFLSPRNSSCLSSSFLPFCPPSKFSFLLILLSSLLSFYLCQLSISCSFIHFSSIATSSSSWFLFTFGDASKIAASGTAKYRKVTVIILVQSPLLSYWHFLTRSVSPVIPSWNLWSLPSILSCLSSYHPDYLFYPFLYPSHFLNISSHMLKTLRCISILLILFSIVLSSPPQRQNETANLQTLSKSNAESAVVDETNETRVKVSQFISFSVNQFDSDGSI